MTAAGKTYEEIAQMVAEQVGAALYKSFVYVMCFFLIYCQRTFSSLLLSCLDMK